MKRLSAKQVSVILLITGAIFIAIGGILYDTGIKNEETALSKVSGQITSPAKNPSDVFTVLYASNIKHYTKAELSNGIDLQKFIQLTNRSYDLKISFDKDTNNLLITSELTNAQNDPIAYIANNKWKANPDSMYIGDRNYNAYAFEVINKYDIPLLQVLMVNESTIAIGTSIEISPDYWAFMTINGGAVTIDNPTLEDLQHIADERLFVYPSDTNLGQMVVPHSHWITHSDGTWTEMPSDTSLTPQFVENNPLFISNLQKWFGVILGILGTIFIGIFGAITVQETKKGKKH